MAPNGIGVPTSSLSRSVERALSAAPDETAAARAREALASYLANPDPAGAVILLSAMTHAVGEDAAYAALDFRPPAKGLVWCCPTMGWVTPAKRDEHVYDSSFGWDD